MWNTSLAALAGGALARPGYGVTREIPVPECGRAFQPAGHDCHEACLDGAAEALTGAAAVIMDYSQGGVVPSAQYSSRWPYDLFVAQPFDASQRTDLEAPGATA